MTGSETPSLQTVPHFAQGTAVTVRTAFPTGHCRTPHYCRGKSGIVERICGTFPNPESLAYGRDGAPAIPLYRVRFLLRTLWDDYSGPAADTIDIELYEHWLQPNDKEAQA